MADTRKDPSLEHDHSAEAIARRLKERNDHATLGDFVLGAVDGTITTFAIVSGVAGAGLSTGVAIVLGLANVLADGFSMAVGNYLKSRSDMQVVDNYRKMEERHIEHIPDGEREEIRQIFASKGFEGETLEEVVDVITDDRKRWVDTMLTEEWGLQIEGNPPVRAGLVTFAAFVLAGMIPLSPLFLAGRLTPQTTFIASAVATAVAFALIGAVRARVTNESLVRGSLETVLVGGIAASLAFVVGAALKEYTGLGSL